MSKDFEARFSPGLDEDEFRALDKEIDEEDDEEKDDLDTDVVDDDEEEGD